MKIALDIESTLADIPAAFRDEYEKRHGERPEISTTWGFDNVSYDASTFHEITQSIWKHNSFKILPTEDPLSIPTRKIYETSSGVDLVTGRQGVEEKMRKWAEFQDVWFDDLISVSSQEEKADLGYDILIDDAPRHLRSLNDDQYLFLYNQPYNRNEPLPKNATRVDNLHQCELSLLEVRNEDGRFKSAEHRG